jgi:hypothetical protein
VYAHVIRSAEAAAADIFAQAVKGRRVAVSTVLGPRLVHGRTNGCFQDRFAGSRSLLLPG